MWEGLGLVQILFGFGCSLCIPALRSLHAKPLILDNQVLTAALWPLEAVAWLLGDSGDGALEILDCTSSMSWGSSGHGAEFRAMLNPAKGESIASRIPLSWGEHYAGGWAAQ